MGDDLLDFLAVSGLDKGLIAQREADLIKERGVPKGGKEPRALITPELVKPFNPFSAGLENAERFLFAEWFQRPLLDLRACSGVQRGVYAVFNVAPMVCEPHLKLKYHRVVDPAGRWPLYVGESDIGEEQQGIGDRCNCHITSITDAGLGVENFAVKFIVLPKLINAERTFIEAFRPAWNGSGFGLRPSAPTFRSNGSRTSVWDTLHPGREVTGKHSRSYAKALRWLDGRLFKNSEAFSRFRQEWPELIDFDVRC